MTKIGTIIKNTQAVGQYLNGLSQNKKQKNHFYQLAFIREGDGCWYIDLPEWKGSHASLEMVAGADTLLEYIAQGKARIEVTVAKSHEAIEALDNNPDFFRCDQLHCSIIGGSTYQVNLANHHDTMWLCPVTLFVLGEFPKYLYIKKSN